MTFLELCQRVFQECAVSGTLDTTIDQTGENKRIVDWTAQAYKDICQRHDNWRFLRSDFTLSTVASTQAYLPTGATDTRLSASILEAGFDRWWDDTLRIYLSSAGVGTQNFLGFTNYPLFRDRWLFQSPGNQMPSTFSIRPDDDALLLGATPDAVYVITGQYQRFPVALEADDDEPLMRAQYHMAIVWAAVKNYAGFEEDGGLYDHAQREFSPIDDSLERKELPAFELGCPLA